jgi:3-hydroxyisobutyrate dehydrogenase
MTATTDGISLSNPAIGFIGFGEAGSNIAKGLRSAGVERIFAFDIDPGPRVRNNAAESRTVLVDSLGVLAAAADVFFLTVTASSALDAAKQISPFLHARQIYADLNSVSPALKQEIEQVIRAGGAGFVEAAVMSAVPPHAHRVPMLLGGTEAEAFAELLSPFGMRFEVLSGKVGTAAAVKMCRSIVVKGLEALLVECVLGASLYEADERVFASLNESIPGIDWKKLADYMVGRVVVHGERRAHEMEEVARTLRAIGIEPIMAEATARRQSWTAEQDLRSQFGPNGPEGYRDVVAVLGNRNPRVR